MKTSEYGGDTGLKTTAQETANTLLHSFLAIKEKHNYPLATSTDKINVYTHVLSLRPGYTNSVIKKVLTDAHKFSIAKGEVQGISLNTLVLSVLIYEYAEDQNIQLNGRQLTVAETAIKEAFNGKNKKKSVAWYWVSLIGVVGAVAGGVIGGAAGSLVTVLAGHLFLLISLVLAVSGGIRGSGGKVSAGSRIGAFLLALVIALIALAINGSFA